MVDTRWRRSLRRRKLITGKPIRPTELRLKQVPTVLPRRILLNPDDAVAPPKKNASHHFGCSVPQNNPPPPVRSEVIVRTCEGPRPPKSLGQLTSVPERVGEPRLRPIQGRPLKTNPPLLTLFKFNILSITYCNYYRHSSHYFPQTV